MKIKTLSRRLAEEYVPQGNAICISINERSMSFAEIPVDKYESVLRLVFDDVDDGTHGGGIIPFNTDHAKKIIKFVEPYWNNIDELIVHCTMGISRSCGVALGLLDYYDEPPTLEEEKRNAWRLHNRKVRSTIRKLRPQHSA